MVYRYEIGIILSNIGRIRLEEALKKRGIKVIEVGESYFITETPLSDTDKIAFLKAFLNILFAEAEIMEKDRPEDIDIKLVKAKEVVVK